MLRHAVLAELRQGLRDTNTLLLSVLFPLLFFPFMLWLGSQVQAVVTGWESGLRPVVAAESRLGDILPQTLERVDPGQPSTTTVTADGRLLRVAYSSADPISVVALGRIEAAYAPNYTVKRHDLSPRKDRVAFALSIALPILLLVMAALSAMYPAIEAAVADRERGTLDTSLVTSAPRWIFPAAKLISVAVVTLCAVLGSAVSTVASFAHFLFAIGVSVDLPFARMVAVLPLAACAAAVASALALAAASPAKDFKQAQNFATTVNSVLFLLPLAAVANPEAPITAVTGSIPYLNLALVMRDTLLGHVEPGWVVVAVVESLAIAVAANFVALFFLRRNG